MSMAEQAQNLFTRHRPNLCSENGASRESSGAKAFSELLWKDAEREKGMF